MSNDTPLERSAATKPLRVVDDAPRANGSQPAASTPASEFSASEELARFLQHASRLEREGESLGTLRAWLDLAEAWRITQALRACKGNRSAAARMLGIGRRTLYSKMDKLDITPTWSI
jgi:DNA-binding NtrC family response regulator